MGKDKEEEKNGGKKTPFRVWFSIFVLLVTAGVFLPTTIVLTVCLIPTVVAAVVDNQIRKTAWLTVGAMNMAGTVPVWLSLVDAGHTIGAAFQIVLQPQMLLVAYGGAAAGWAIYNHVTPLIASMVLSKNERRVKDIEKRQKELIRKWGDGVILR